MIDIFESNDQPSLFIVDVTIKFATKGKGVVKMNKTHDIFMRKTIENIPILLVNKDGVYSMPNDVYKNSFTERATKYLTVGFKPGTASIDEIKNVKYSSKICYKFNY